MCGILYINSDHSKVYEAKESLKHRGVESGHAIINKKHIIHHRLPIQTKDGDEFSQPIQLNKNVFLLFNGEVFNYPHTFKNDVEFVTEFFTEHYCMSSYRITDQIFTDWFYNAIQYWDGFWSFVIVDFKYDQVIAFTDPLGKKQLYYDKDGNIASELKPLRQLQHNFVSINSRFISTFHKWGYNYDDQTPYEGIRRIMPNKIYKFSIYDPESCKPMVMDNYFSWQPTDENNRFLTGDWNREKSKTRLLTLLQESIKNRVLHSNYSMGILLSGGLDSTIIAYLASKIHKNFTCYTIQNGETPYAELVANEYGLPLEYIGSYLECPDEKLEIIYGYHNESPIDLGSVIPQYFLFKKVKENNDEIRVVISGDGADELFGGYKRAQVYDSQQSDVFHELSFYHLPRLDRMSMAFTLELRNPFLSHDIIRFALGIPYHIRTKKQFLKSVFEDVIPKEIIHRIKLALKHPNLVRDKTTHMNKALNHFITYHKKLKIC